MISEIEMRKMNEFINIKEGELFVDRILFDSYYPILFSCRNQEGDFFICVCCKNNQDGIKWLIGKTEADHIIKVLENRITVRDLLLRYTSSKITVDKINGEFKVSYNNDDWNDNSIYLPKHDSFLNPDPGEFDEEIQYYRKERSKNEYSTVYKNLLEKQFENKGNNIEVDEMKYACGGHVNIIGQFERTIKTVQGSVRIKMPEHVKMYKEHSVKEIEVKKMTDMLRIEIETDKDIVSNFARAV